MMTTILALDTSTDACTAALLINDSIVEKFQLAQREHVQLILPFIQTLLAEAGLTLSQLDAIAFGCGPGSFTGLRIAASVTQGLAYAHDLPVIAVSSLQALAQGAWREFYAKQVAVAMDAHMQSYYWGAYTINAQHIMQPICQEQLYKSEELALQSEGHCLAIGNAWSLYNLLDNLSTPDLILQEYNYPHAHDIATLAKIKFSQNEIVKAEHALPVYLREASTWKKIHQQW